MRTTKQSAGLFPKAVLAGIGAAAATLDWTRAFLAKAIERGEMAEMEAKETSEYAAPGQPAPAPSAAQTVKAEPMREADQPATRLRLPWVATRSDLSELNRQLDRLDAQVTALEQQQANSATEAASEAP